MAIFDLYSKRKRREQGKVPDVFTYEQIPIPFKVQVVHIWGDAFGNFGRNYSLAPKAFKDLHDVLCREYGVYQLGDELSHKEAVTNFFVNEADTEKALDIMELSFQVVSYYCNEQEYITRSEPTVSPEEAIAELNQRFLEHGLGYEFVSGKLIRKDKELLHKEVVLPTLLLLHQKKFAGANEEFLKAHEHYRQGRYKECLAECLKAFESTMKVICKGRKWGSKETDTAKTLIDICLKNDLLPAFLQSQCAAVRTCLESGIPTVRNKLGGHGQGAEPKSVPQYYASYLLHLTATTIVLLTDADAELGEVG